MENAEHGGKSVNTEGIPHDNTPVYPEARPDGYYEDVMNQHSELHITVDTIAEQSSMLQEHPYVAR